MYCEECGKKIPDDSRFCDGCGAPVHQAKEQKTDGEEVFYGFQRAPVPGGMYPEKEKKNTGTTVLIAVLSVVAVVLVGVLIFLGIKTFGGKGSQDKKAASAQTSSASQEGLEETEEETEGERPFIAPSQTAPETSTTAPVSSEALSMPAAKDYILPNSNSSYLAESDLTGLSREQLRLARNEIYARHGRKFKDDALNRYFMEKSWYTPLYEPDQFNEGVFNDYEIANRKLIADYEKKMGY